MNIVQISQILGTVSILGLFCILFYMVINNRLFRIYGRTAVLWTCIYVFFLFILRLMMLFQLATLDQLRVISGFSSLIPLCAILVQYFLLRNLKKYAE